MSKWGRNIKAKKKNGKKLNFIEKNEIIQEHTKNKPRKKGHPTITTR